METAGVALLFGRRLWPRRSELTRRVDWIEAALLVAAVTVGLLLLPVALMVGSETYVSQSQLAAEQARTRQEATATLLVDAPKPTVGLGEEVARASTSAVRAQWMTPSGEIRVGQISVADGSKAGTEVPVWLDPDGNPVAKPLTSAGATASAVTIASVMWVTAVAFLASLFLTARAVLNRCRSLAWQRAWAQVEPEWSRRQG